MKLTKEEELKLGGKEGEKNNYSKLFYDDR